jgi:hypothetical protein
MDRAVSVARGRQAYALWISLAPLLVKAPTKGTWEEARRDEIIDAGLSAATTAMQWAPEDDGITDQERLNVIYTLAFFRACSHHFGLQNSDLGLKALQAMPSDDIQIGTLSPAKQETVAWVRMSCTVPEDPIWEKGRQLARKLYLDLLPNQQGEADETPLRSYFLRRRPI